MAGVHAGRGGTCVLAALGLLLIAVPRAQAVEALDGRIQAHGFLEMQIRGLDRDYEEEFDLAQWYNVVNVELEFDVLPDGWGPFDLLQAYVRLEGRFDCLYYDACGIFPSARTYGNKSRNLPLRLRDAFDEDYAGAIDSNDEANPPGHPYRVPDEGKDARDPTGWVVTTQTTLPVNPVGDKSYKPGETYDPWLDNADDPPDLPPDTYGNSYCPTNGLIGTAENPIGCYTNRPTVFEIEKRLGFPGFDTVFDINGADGELGPSPDYFLADPDATVNDVIAEYDALGVEAGDGHDPADLLLVRPMETAMRGLAFERDDPAYYTFGVKVDTSIINKVDVSAIRLTNPDGTPRDPAEIQQEAEKIVYGVDPEDPDSPTDDKLKGTGGFAEKIRDAGQLYTLDPILDWKLTFRDKVGPQGGTGQTLVMGPWLPKNFFGSLAAASDRANPFRGRETPTYINRSADDPTADRDVGQRYHILDVASGEFDPTADCELGRCTYGPDPVDPRLLKYEQMLIAADLSHYEIEVGGKNPSAQSGYFGPYPNRYMSGVESAQGEFSLSFGGDFNGIVARYNTYTSRPIFGAALTSTNFIEQIAVPGTLGFNSNSFEKTIAYTNVEVTGGLGELPMRPAPDRSNLSKLDLTQAQGLYIPSRGLVGALSSQDLDDHEFNISHIDRAFNHGASQSDTYEVKEAYLDMEFLDSRLWVRAGIQNIVWGKTELFRTTDQFNPQDLAMASLPGLEESRIALLSARAVYAFYDVGPLEDVRFELAANFDRFKPNDLGACGEPYTFDAVCGATFGLAIHSLAGIGLAGVDRPPSGWDDVKGIEFGGRIEFRWDRFSFAITDFYGYDDMPYPDPIFFYERNVDPNTGRPRKAGAKGPCENAAGFPATINTRLRTLHAGNPVWEFIRGDSSAAPTGELTAQNVFDDYSRRGEVYSILGVGIDEACLKPGGAPGGPNENRYDPAKGSDLDPDDFDSYSGINYLVDPNSYIYHTQGQWALPESSVDYALAYHPANQQFFAALCSTTITVAVSLTPGACGFNIFGSPTRLLPLVGASTDPTPFSEYVSTMTAGEIHGSDLMLGPWRLIQQYTKSGTDVKAVSAIPSSPMNRDVRDGIVTATGVAIVKGGAPWSVDNYLTLDSTLTSEQKALLGCGPFFGTRCDSGKAGTAVGVPNWSWGEGGGIDVLNAEASAVLQAFPGVEGTAMTANNPNYAWHADVLATEEQLDQIEGATRTEIEDVATAQLEDLLADVGVTDPGYVDAIINAFNSNYSGTYDSWAANSTALAKKHMENYYVVQPGDSRFPSPTGVTAQDVAAGYLIPLSSTLIDDTIVDNCPVGVPQSECDKLAGAELKSVPLEELPEIELAAGEIKSPGYPRLVEGLGQWVEGSESEDYLLDTWVTWSDDLQPGTVAAYTIGSEDPSALGRSFEGMEYCTRYAPDSPYANENGIVRLPGCRGVESVTINPDSELPAPSTRIVEVVFEEHYTPKQDGCIFGETITDRANNVYYVRPVKEDGTLDSELFDELQLTCWNPNANAVSLRSTHRWTPEFDTRDPSDPKYPNTEDMPIKKEIRDTWPYLGVTESMTGARTLFHPMAGCENAGLDLRGNFPWMLANDPGYDDHILADQGYLCDFRFRNLEADFIEGHAQVFRTEVADWSWNFLMFLTVTSCNSASGGDDLNDKDCFNPDWAWDVTRCSLSTPQFCRNVKSFLAIGATNRNDVRAGGNDRFGRRDFIWHSGGEAILRYDRRNVFGFSMDFAEDVSKTNWGLEFTWFGDRPFMNNNSWDLLTQSQTLNLTISVDRPTFINFLNANRTFFFNTQWFFQYLLDYDKGFTGTTGPFNVLFTFAFFTGYFQDRLLPNMVTVYDFRSQSGGFLPSIQYRFNERFSVTFGVSWWIGRGQYIPMPLRSLAPVSNRAGPHAYEDGAEFLISNFRHRDEAYMRIRWTF